MTMPGLLLDQAPTMAPPAPPPQQRRPSILDRIMGRFFPSGASPYGSLLSQDQLGGLRRGALQRMAAQLLAESGPRPQGTTGPLEGLGHALQAAQWPEALQQAGQQANQVSEMQRRNEQRRAIEGAIAEFPPVRGETLQQTGTRVTQMMSKIARIGGPEAEQAMSALSQQMRALETQHQLQRPEDPKVPVTQILSNVQGREEKWKGIEAVVRAYQQFRDKPSTQPNDATLLAQASALTNVHGQYFPESGNALAKVPEVGHLIALIQSLMGHEKLTAAQRAEVIETTDAVVDRLDAERGYDRADAERQLRASGATDQDIQGWLRTPRPFRRGRGRARTNVDQMDNDLRNP